MSARRRWPFLGGLEIWLSAAVLLLTGTLSWFGYRAVQGWRASAALVAERRAGEAADLLVSVINRDMRGVQTVVLPSFRAEEFRPDQPYDASDVAAGAFARYPYAESFFAWSGAPSAETVVFFHRADSAPAWAGGGPPSRFPVVVQSHPDVARLLVERILKDAEQGRRFSVFEAPLGGVPHQIVTRLLYGDPVRERLEAAFGFTVNLTWVRTHYFRDLAQQVARIGNTSGLSIRIRDADGKRVTAVPRDVRGEVAARRRFALSFFDPLVVEQDSDPRMWVVETAVAADPTLRAAVRAGNRTLLLIAIAAATLAAGLMLTLQAARQSAKLAEMRSEFVSTVTHELKTPIATIRAIGDTLARQRVTDPEGRLQYAQLIVQESKRLSRLVDNLLAYSRVTDLTEVYSFEPLGLGTVIEESLRGFRTQLTEREFDVRVGVPAALPPVRADRAALILAIDNVVDNAIRYSADRRVLEIGARREGAEAVLEIRDHGIGIPAGELPLVTRRFHRAPGTGSGGSGLGLTIVKRVVSDHGGTLAIRSTVGEGTTVQISLPLAVDG